MGCALQLIRMQLMHLQYGECAFVGAQTNVKLIIIVANCFCLDGYYSELKCRMSLPESELLSIRRAPSINEVCCFGLREEEGGGGKACSYTGVKYIINQLLVLIKWEYTGN